MGEVRHAGMEAEEAFVLVRGRPGSWQPRAVIRIGEGVRAEPLVLTRSGGACEGEALYVRAPDWHYSRCVGGAVEFVTSKAPAAAVVVSTDAAGLHMREWLPFDNDDEPGGVLLSVGTDERFVVASLVTAGGRKTLATYYRESAEWGDARGNALRLSGDRVALVTVETIAGDPAQSTIMLRVIAEGEIITSRVAHHSRGWAAVAAAARDDELTIIGAPFDGSGIVALIVDPANADQVLRRELTQTAAAVPNPGIRLVRVGDRFIAGWIRLRDGAVQICEFNRRGVFPEITVSRGDSSTAMSLGLGPGGESPAVTVFGMAEGGSVWMRQIPQPVSGTLAADDLFERLSRWVSAAASWAR